MKKLSADRENLPRHQNGGIWLRGDLFDSP